MGREPKEDIEDKDDAQIDDAFEPLEEQKPSFQKPSETVTQLPINDNNVIEILRMVLDPQGLQKLQFTEVEVSWTRSLIKTDMVNYAYYVQNYATDPDFDWQALNVSLGYRETDDILLPLEVMQYSLSKWQRAKGRKLIKDAHELALSSKEETAEDRMLRGGSLGA